LTFNFLQGLIADKLKSENEFSVAYSGYFNIPLNKSQNLQVLYLPMHILIQKYYNISRITINITNLMNLGNVSIITILSPGVRYMCAKYKNALANYTCASNFTAENVSYILSSAFAGLALGNFSTIMRAPNGTVVEHRLLYSLHIINVSKREYNNTPCIFIVGYIYNNSTSMLSTCLSTTNYIPLNSTISVDNQPIISFFETANLAYSPQNISQVPPDSKIISGG